MKKRVVYCDVLRLIAILSVVAIHVFIRIRDTYVLDRKDLYFITTFFDSLTRTGVPLFFMLTGIFMLKGKIENYKDYFKKRLPRLIILYILFSIFYYIFDCFLAKCTFNLIDMFMFISDIPARYHLWFMPVIIMIYLLIPFIKIMVDKINKVQLRNLIMLIFTFGNLLLTIRQVLLIFDINVFGIFIFPDLFIYINYLLLGYYLYNYDIRRKKLVYILAIISIILMPFASLLFCQPIRNDWILTATSILPIFPTIAIFILFKNRYDKFKIPKVIEKFAVNNNNLIFYVYLIHVFIMEIIEKIIYKIYVPKNFIENFTMTIITLIITFILSYIASYLLDDILIFIRNQILNDKNDNINIKM